MARLIFTQQKPSTTGYYWARVIDDGSSKETNIDPDNMCIVFVHDGVFEIPGQSGTFSIENNSTMEWAGPIQRPVGRVIKK